MKYMDYLPERCRANGVFESDETENRSRNFYSCMQYDNHHHENVVLMGKQTGNVPQQQQQQQYRMTNVDDWKKKVSFARIQPAFSVSATI